MVIVKGNLGEGYFERTLVKIDESLKSLSNIAAAEGGTRVLFLKETFQHTTVITITLMIMLEMLFKRLK